MRKYPFSIYRDITSSPDNLNKSYSAKNTYNGSTAGRNLIIAALIVAILSGVLLAASYSKHNKPTDVVEISEPKIVRSVRIE